MTLSNKNLLKSLTGIRCIAAFWVVLFHLSSLITFIKNPVFSVGWIGVDLFFILSGFIISYNYTEKFKRFDLNNYLNFLWLRLARMYPVHIFTLLIVVLLYSVMVITGKTIKTPETFYFVDLIKHIFLVQAWGFGGIESWNDVSWSISTEWFAYILFPLITSFVLMFKKKENILIMSLILLPIMITYFIISFDNPEINRFNSIVKILFEFTTGCFLCRLYNNKQLSNINWKVINNIIPLLLVISIYMIFNFNIGKFGNLPYLLMTPLFATFILGLAYEDNKYLSNKIMLYWGEVSYSVYMTHSVVFMILRQFLKINNETSFFTKILFLFIYLSAVIVVSKLTYEFIETPARRRMRNLVSFSSKKQEYKK